MRRSPSTTTNRSPMGARAAVAGHNTHQKEDGPNADRPGHFSSRLELVLLERSGSGALLALHCRWLPTSIYDRW